MHRHISTARESDEVRAVAGKMRDENIGFIPVLDDGDVVIGVVTDRDIVVRACVGTTDPRQVRVGSMMSRAVISCRPTDAVETAERRMRDHRVSRLLVLDDEGALAGVISLSDIAQYDSPGRVGRTLQAIAERKYAF